MIAWSYGGGWQSVAIGVLIREGALPRPDLVGIADTSREIGTTWEYLYGTMQPYLDKIGLKIEVAPHTLARVDMYDKDGLTLMPAYTRTVTRISGLYEEEEIAEGRLSAFCSGEWKRDVMERWLRLKGVKECEQWIGYSLDEEWRVKKDHRGWCHLTHPLIEKGITRAMCGRIIEAAGLPLPKKSRCYCCPHQSPEEWLEVQARPEEFAAAIRLDDEIRAKDPREGNNLFLYSGRVPLAMADFQTDAGLQPPARACEAGHCWT